MAWTPHSAHTDRAAAALPAWLIGLLFFAAIFAAARPADAQTTIYVNAAAAPGGNGESWGTAFQHLQDALDEAYSREGPQTIWMAQGRFTPVREETVGDPRSRAFVFPANQAGKYIYLYGGFVGYETAPEQRTVPPTYTVLSGDHNADDGPGLTNQGDNSYIVLRAYFATFLTLDGVQVDGGSSYGCLFNLFPDTGGWAKFTDCVFYRNGHGFHGTNSFNGVELNLYADRCKFVANGFGLYLREGVKIQGIADCLFARNETAAYLLNGVGSTPIFFNQCTFADNTQSITGNELIDTQGRFNACVLVGPELYTSFNSYNHIAPSTTNEFVDPDGADNVPGTLDDDYRLSGLVAATLDRGLECNIFPACVVTRVRDLAGNRRRWPSEGAWDFGAFEFGSPPFGFRRFVRADLPEGSGDGLSWPTAFGGRDGLVRALAEPPADVAEIWVAAGTYAPSAQITHGGSRADSFQLRSNLVIYGGFSAGGGETELSQRNIAANETILSGDLNGDDNGDLNRGDNSFSVLRATGIVNAAVDGFSIVAGTGDGVPGDTQGGGVRLFDCAINIRSCRIENNKANQGGAVAISGSLSNVTFADTLFERNSGLGNDPSGGAVWLDGVAGVAFVRTDFVENTAFRGGAFMTAGGVSQSVAFVDCDFVRNAATTSATESGAVYGVGSAINATSAAFVNCRFFGNRVTGVGSEGSPSSYGCIAIGDGGVVANSLFVGNTAGVFGRAGAIYGFGNAAITNSVFIANAAPTGLGGGVILDGQPNGGFSNNLCWENVDSSGATQDSQLALPGPFPVILNLQTNSVQHWSGSLGGTGNNGLDPRFRRMPSPGADGVWGTIDDDYGDLRLTNGSPAIDSGDSTAVPLDTYDIDGDGNTTESLPWDLDGLARFVDDPLIANTGMGSPPVDRGCYEFVPPIVTAPGDRRWVSPEGGNFSSLFNWFPAVPGAQDNAVFDIPGEYTVDFAASSPTQTRLLTVTRGHPMLDLNGSTYSITAPFEAAMIVGELPGVAAELTITDGTLAPFSGLIGAESGSIGTLNVSGPGARLLMTQGDLAVGFFGQGHMLIENGGRATTRTAGVGDQPGSQGSTVLVTGAQSKWTVPFLLTINNGSVRVCDSGTLENTFGIVIFQEGVLGGNGTIIGPVINFGSIEPGCSPGSLTINGSYTQVGTIADFGADSGRLRMEVSGPAANQHDKLMVTGAATLGGGLFVEFTGGYAPEPDGMGNFPSFRLLETSTPLASRFDVAFFPPVPAVSGQGAKFLRAIYPNRGPGAVDLVIADLGINPEFNDPDMLEILGGPTAAAVGDLNRDGLPDLAITLPDTEDPDNNDGVLIILFNQGLDNDDQWLGFGGAAQVNVQKFPSGVAIGDFDGVDGNDVAVVNMRSNTLNIISQQSAAGTFDNALTLPTGLEPTSVAAFNLDRAGRIDLGVTDGGDDTVGMYANSNLPGTPGFTRTTIPVGMRPTAIRPFNPDNDKDVDCAIINNGTAALSVLPNLGFGTFGPAITIPVGADPVGIIAAPLLDRAEGDNREDLVVVNRDGGSVSVIVNTTPVATTDALSFAPAVESVLNTTNPAGAQPSSLTVVDMDDDGDRDLAVLARATDDSATVVRVLRNDLNGGEQLAFAESAELAAGLGPVAVLSADVDGDGRQDLITVNAQGPRGPGTGSVQTLRSALDPPPTVCAADFDQNGELQVADIFSFLTGWFNNIPSAYNFGGTPGVPAIFAFLAAWFAGC